MSIIKNWEPARNSRTWEKVVEDSEGPEASYGSGRLFVLHRKLKPSELIPLTDMEQACACEIEFRDQQVLVDEPLIRIVHHYLESLSA